MNLSRLLSSFFMEKDVILNVLFCIDAKTSAGEVYIFAKFYQDFISL